MRKKLLWIVGIFAFLSIITWQRLEVMRRRYKMADYSKKLESVRLERDRNFLKKQEIKSSERMMRFGYEKKYKFPSASEVIVINNNE